MFYYTKNDAIILPISLVVIVGLSIALAFLLKGKSQKLRKLPLQILAVFVVCCEIAKQIYYSFQDFTLYVLPLHFCSLFIILLPLSQLCGEKVGKIFKPVAIVYGIIMMFIFYLNPHSVIGSACNGVFANFHNWHTFFFHHAVIFYFVLSFALGDCSPKITDCIAVSGGVVFYASYAIPCAFALNQNYTNILYSSFAPFEQFRLWAGQVWYDIVLFLIAIAFINLIFFTYYFIDRGVKKHKEAKTKIATLG